VWVLSAACPADWASLLERCGGGFFHSPSGLDVGAPPGQPLFARLVEAGQVTGIAALVRGRCRLSLRPGHVHAPTFPALMGSGPCSEALADLIAALARGGAAEVVMASFDARWNGHPAPDAHATPLPQRREYEVSLNGGPDQHLARCSDTHARHLRRGEREQWAFRSLDEAEGLAVLSEVQAVAARRIAARGVAAGEIPARPPRAPAMDVTEPWGTRVFSAWASGQLLAAALVGWANQRGFYVQGGSTARGYERSAAVWLHWRIMGVLAAQGCTAYNLGGTAASADRPGDPEHGLYRFKTGFGVQVRLCQGVHWAMRPWHLGVHRVARSLSSWLRGSPT